MLEQIGLPLWDAALEQREPDGTLTLVHGLREFREHLGGELHITLLRDIGRSFEVTEMDEAAILDADRQISRSIRPASIGR